MLFKGSLVQFASGLRADTLTIVGYDLGDIISVQDTDADSRRYNGIVSPCLYQGLRIWTWNCDHCHTDINGPHQGGWVETSTGESWFINFQDKAMYGRVLQVKVTGGGIWYFSYGLDGRKDIQSFECKIVLAKERNVNVCFFFFQKKAFTLIR